MSEIENMPAVAPALQVRAVAALLGSYQYRFGAETQLQERLAAVLKEGGRDFEREYRIDPQNRADFWLGGLVIGSVSQHVARHAE